MWVMMCLGPKVNGIQRGGEAAHTSLDILEILLQVPIEYALHQSRSHGTRTHRAAQEALPLRVSGSFQSALCAVI